MDHSGYSLYSEEIPPEYQAIFQNQYEGQNVYQASPLNLSHGEEYWAPFLGSSQTLDNAYISASSTTAQAGPSQMDTGGACPPVFSGEQAWNYSYYWHLLPEAQQLGPSSSVSVDNSDFCNPSQCVTLPSEPNTSFDSNAQSTPSSLYSTMLKKGLNIMPGFLNTDDVHQSKCEPSRKLLNQRRNSYPSSTPNPITRPSASMPLDPISLNVPRKSHKKPSKVFGSAIHEIVQETNDSVLNNSVNISCSPSSKCTLNVNNDFHKMTRNDKEPAQPKTTDKKMESEDKQPIKRKPKVKVSHNPSQDSSSFSNSQDSAPKCKSRVSQGKTKSKTERGKPNRKRHSVPDTGDPYPLVNLVFQLRVLLSRVPIQPWLTSLSEALGSLVAMSLGLLWVFAILSYEWAQTLFQVLQSWFLRFWYWVQAHGGDLIRMVFLRIPSDYYSSATGRGKVKNSGVESSLPKTGEEAVQRLLKIKKTDPYSILGIPPDATDEEIKRSYKSQAILVHPDKNHFSGAEEAFKILASAFEILGNPENRASYDKENVLNRPQSEANQEISDFLEKLKQNIEEAQSFLGCQNCGNTHRRYRMDRSPSEARYCASCKERHAAKEGDLWAETTMMGFKWHYYSYLDGAIFDVTEWVTCQPNLVSRVEANTHFVPCRLATPKNKNRSAAYSRMEDLKDLVDELLNANQNGGTDFASARSAPPNGKTKTKKASGGRRKK